MIISDKETVTDISLPLHKHLHLLYIHTSMGVCHVTHQLEFLPVTPGFLHAGTAAIGFFPHRGSIFLQATCVSNRGGK